jgi:hypothetical protein
MAVWDGFRRQHVRDWLEKRWIFANEWLEQVHQSGTLQVSKGFALNMLNRSSIWNIKLDYSRVSVHGVAGNADRICAGSVLRRE